MPEIGNKQIDQQSLGKPLETGGGAVVAFSERLAATQRLDPLVRAEVLEKLIETCGVEERPAVAAELLELASVEESGRRWPWQKPVGPGATRALCAIAGAWELWPDELRSVAMAIGRERWQHVLADSIASMSVDARRGVARLVSENLTEPLGELAPRVLVMTDSASAARLERAILSRAFAAAGLDEQTGERMAEEDAGGLSRIERIVAGACANFHEHQCRRVLLAAAALLNPRDLGLSVEMESVAASEVVAALGDAHAAAPVRATRFASPVASWFWSLDERGRVPLAALIRSARHPLMRVRAWEWSRIPGLAGACAERLSRSASLAEHEGVLSRWHLSLNPRRGAVMALPAPEELASLSPDARVGAARLAPGALGRDGARSLLSPLLGDADVLVRHAASLAATPTELADFSFDAHGAIAASASRRWSLAGLRSSKGGLLLRAVETDDGTRRRLASRLARAPVGAVRRVARQELGAYDWAVGSSPAARLAARHMLARDPEGATRRLLEEIESPDVGRRLGAIGVIRALALHEVFAARLVAIARESAARAPVHTPIADPRSAMMGAPEDGSKSEAGVTSPGADARLRATAISALSDVPMLAASSRDAERAIEECLHDGDPRVRANAVEAVARRVRHSPGAGDHALLTLLELKDDGAHRARANALRGLLETAAGEPSVEGVHAMLSDERPMHRLAGVWLAGRVLPGVKPVIAARYGDLVGAVKRMAEKDEDEHVRRRALHAAALMAGGVA
ncbi:MAG: hypothetical protein IT434_15885 [Phycisphaerales bacterium]|nr:hypothetical protein [Phycisphaerales bacterium]